MCVMGPFYKMSKVWKGLSLWGVVHAEVCGKGMYLGSLAHTKKLF